MCKGNINNCALCQSLRVNDFVLWYWSGHFNVLMFFLQMTIRGSSRYMCIWYICSYNVYTYQLLNFIYTIHLYIIFYILYNFVIILLEVLSWKNTFLDLETRLHPLTLILFKIMFGLSFKKKLFFQLLG